MKLSIITPSYNQGRYIERTIQSVLSQEIADLEYWVLDGGSQDDTVSILEHYSKQLQYHSAKDAGQADAVNKGLRLATGDIIGWLNSDDIYYPNAFKKIMDYFASHPDVDVVYGDAYHIDQNDRVIELYPTEAWDLQRFKKTCFISQPSVFFRRRILQKHGYLNDSLHFCLDYEYWLRLALQGVKFGYLKEIIAGSRLYPETKTLSAPLTAQREALSMLHRHLGSVSPEWLLTYSITVIKHKTRLRYPGPLFLLSAWLVTCYQILHWSGGLQAVKGLFSIPFAMLAIKQKNREGKHARDHLVSGRS
jgi:glycosyltransferase involved in cell wall biosynthesis